MVSHKSLSDSKSHHVPRTFLSILVNHNNVVVCMISTRRFIFKSSIPSTNPLATVPSVSITIGITVTFTFHCFSVLEPGQDTYLYFHFPSVLPCGQSEQQDLFCVDLFLLSLLL